MTRIVERARSVSVRTGGFYVATLMFHRQRQLKDGARPRVDSRGHTSTRIAVLEVLAGLVVAAS